MGIYDEESELYDIAFSWDLGPEVEWLLWRLGPGVKTLLEPGCGSGRMFPEFVRRGVRVVGVDASEAMLRRAAGRMARLKLPAPRTFRADMAEFDLGQRFDGAICPIQSDGAARNNINGDLRARHDVVECDASRPASELHVCNLTSEVDGRCASADDT